MTISNQKTGNDLKSFITDCGTMKGLKPEKMRLFYGGKELKNDKELFNYNLEEESIIQMMYAA